MDPELLLKQLGINLIADAEHLEQVVIKTANDASRFEFGAKDPDSPDGNVLQASIAKSDDGEDEFILNGIASSTIKDRHGDVMLPSALIEMERAANNGLTMFFNHKYEIPEEVAGTVKHAKLVSTGTDDEGNPIYDLRYSFRIDRTNPRAVQSWNSIHKSGTRLGLSIGARIPEGGAIRNKKTGRLLIAHVDLLETSMVGVPANPRSWVEMAVKAVKSAEKAYVVSTAPAPVEIAASLEPLEDDVVMDSAITETTELPVAAEFVPGDTGEETVVLSTPSQEAPESEPGIDGSPASDDVEAASPEPEVQVDLATSTPMELIEGLAKAATTISDLSVKLSEASQALLRETQRADNAERERDRVVAGASALALDTAQIIQRLGALPVGRKASYRRIVEDFDDGLETAKDVYGNDTIALLRSMTKQP